MVVLGPSSPLSSRAEIAPAPEPSCGVLELVLVTQKKYLKFKFYLEKLPALQVKPLRELFPMVRGMLRAGHAPGWPQGKSILQEAQCPPPYGVNAAKTGKKKQKMAAVAIQPRC